MGLSTSRTDENEIRQLRLIERLVKANILQEKTFGHIRIYRSLVDGLDAQDITYLFEALGYDIMMYFLEFRAIQNAKG